jgi:thiamine biosynthesis protein ThiS
VIKIRLNDDELAIAEGDTVDVLLERALVSQTQRVAIAVNDRVIHRADWPTHELKDKDQVLMIAPIQGG